MFSLIISMLVQAIDGTTTSSRQGKKVCFRFNYVIIEHVVHNQKLLKSEHQHILPVCLMRNGPLWRSYASQDFF